MIRVAQQPEYEGFDQSVRQRGQAFLRGNPNPNSQQFKKHNYWSSCLQNLHAVYQGQCAYTSRHLVETGSVDHFLPKSRYPHLAYEWDNFRLARQVINSRKGNSEEVVDPFQVEQGWFVLDLPSCLVKAGEELTAEIRASVNRTINTLALNQDERLVQERCDLLVNLADGDITLRYLDRHYPFLSSEVRRQNVETDLADLFKR